MLIEFRVQNHRSLRDEQVLNLEAAVRGTDDESLARPHPAHRMRLLPAVALYGANASGKSNLLAALGFMQAAVAQSHRFWEPEEGVPRDPFAWGLASTQPSTFEAAFVINEVRYEYGFVVDDERFLEEWLHAWPPKRIRRKQTWFERDADTFKFGEFLKGENRVVEEVTRPNALFLSTAAQHHHKQLMPVYRWFSGISLVNIPRRSRSRFEPPFEVWLSRILERGATGRQASLFPEDSDDAGDVAVDMLRTLLKAADVGIEDLTVEYTDDDRRPGRRRTRVLVRHRSTETDEAWLPLSEESGGTRTLARMAYPILRTLERGGVLVVDELERSLHPLLAAHIVGQFNDPLKNPKDAQIIFTTHDTNLLGTTTGEPLLRRDQVWLTEKNDQGSSCVYSLSDYKPRKEENLERGYLQGRYGAIPFLGDLGRVRE